MTIHAYTEPNCTLPGYINLQERDPGLFVLTVRSSGAQDGQSMHLTREQLMNLVNDASEYLDADPQASKAAASKNLVAAAPRNTDDSSLRAHSLEMALRTPNLTDHHDVLKAAVAYQKHIAGQPAARPDVRHMVNRFLGWKLPSDFAPDAGISFVPSTHPLGWPTGTNLLAADQARAMFEHVLRDE